MSLKSCRSLALSLLVLGQASLCPAADDWLPFAPSSDPFKSAELDLRDLNEACAGEHGVITVKDGRFIHTQNGEPVRFWAVNGPPHDLNGQALKNCARGLAKRGVNLVRIHGGLFDKRGEPNPAKIAHAVEIVEAMKAEGIYSLFSIYFPLWLTPAPDTPWLRGYNGQQHPFAALFFNPDFQAQYRQWWTALLTTPNPRTGKTLAEDPAVFALEMQNEDSFFFWTFSEQNVPDPQLRILERRFGDWLSHRYGSIATALQNWKAPRLPRDVPEEGRVGFRPLWAMFNEKTVRDQDTARFLLEVQTKFYQETHRFLRGLGFKGPIFASNWTTASPEIFGPLEKWSYLAGDAIDRHGYFSCNHKGENAEWSIRPGHTYADRSALRFDPEIPGQPRVFVHPAMDVHYDNKPSIISETTWNRPNRYRSEAPVYFAAYGALQGSDGIVHFAHDGAEWRVKPNFWMQPWTLMSPAMMGQFPAAALIYRRGLIKEGDVVAEVNLNHESLLKLEGSPLPQDAALDELRLKDVPSTAEVRPGQRLDPLLHLAGRTAVRFTNSPTTVRVSASGLVDHSARRVQSSTGELTLDYGVGLLRLNAPCAQGASGALSSSPTITTRDLVLSSNMELGHILLVSLDDRPLAGSKRMLLQVMSEEQPTGFATVPADAGLKRITNIGEDPWQIRPISGRVKLTRPDARELRVLALDHNGYSSEVVGHGPEFSLRPATLYYLITPAP